jgi:hypothetical protein
VSGDLATRSALALAVAGVATAGALAATAPASVPAAQRLHSTDTRLCPFPLEVSVSRRVRNGDPRTLGLTTVVLRNGVTRESAVLTAGGSAVIDPATGSLRFSGRQLWLSAKGHVPYLQTDGKGSQLAPRLVVVGARNPRVVDPCALVADSPPDTTPAETPAPWGLASFALSRIAYAGLTPLIGRPTRHDHMHLDVIVDGRRVTVPAGIGQAEPVDRGPGPCPPPPESRTIGDCAPGRYFTAEVAAAQLQTHTSSGIIHLQAERPGELRLGQLFDVWGVRFDASCLGGHCAGGGKELRVYVGGKRLRGDPRKLALRDQQVIAVVFGGPGSFGSVPSTYDLRWPKGCGGLGERSCFP